MNQENEPVDAEQNGFGQLLNGWFKWIINLGLKKAPTVTKLAIGALVVFAVAVAIISISRGIPLSKVLILAVGVIVVGLAASLVSMELSKGRLGLLGQVLAWSLVVVFVCVSALAISAFFFGVPQAGAVVVAKLIGSPEALNHVPESVKVVTTSEPISALDAVFRRPPDAVSKVDRVAALSKFPDLQLDGATLTLNPGEHEYLAANTLEMTDDRIITNGGSLTIEVLRLVTNDSSIRAFARHGSTVPYGAGGGRVTLIVYDAFSGTRLPVDLSGAPGSPGKAGSMGSRGANGAAGANAASGLFDCKRGAQDGDAGHKGGTGGPGFPGGPGGNGGDLVLVGNIQASDVEFTSNGGTGGKGGARGPGGPGGAGGPGGGARGLCQGGGHSGPTGAVGDLGKPGAEGSAGRHGLLLRRST